MFNLLEIEGGVFLDEMVIIGEVAMNDGIGIKLLKLAMLT